MTDLGMVMGLSLAVLATVIFALCGVVAFMATVIRDIREDAQSFALKKENRRVVREATTQLHLPYAAAARMTADLDRGVPRRPRSRPAPRGDVGEVDDASADDLAREGSAVLNGLVGAEDRHPPRMTMQPPRG